MTTADTIQDAPATGTVPSLPNVTTMLTQQEDQRRQELCEAALGYARHGWRVIPVRWITAEGTCSCHRGEECPSPGKHPVHDDWPSVATCDAGDVGLWWRPPPEGIATEWWPHANIGIVTGRGSGIWVLDVDPRNGGEETLGGHERRNGALPGTRIHQTGSGGVHYLFAHPGFDVRNDSKGKVLGKGLDLRGERGFVVAPPSVSAKGAYELNPAHDIEPVEAPGWMLDMLRREDDRQHGVAVPGDAPDAGLPHVRHYAEAALRAEAEQMRSAEEGTRNDTLNQCAFSLGTLGGAGLLTEDMAWDVLHEAALAAGLGEGEIRGTFLSGWRKGLERPRQIDWRAVSGGREYPQRPWNDIGNTYRMIDHWADTFRWCPERAAWMAYSGGVWTAAYEEDAIDRALSMIVGLPYSEGPSYSGEPEVAEDGKEGPSPRSKFSAWADKQASHRTMKAAAELARGRAAMRISAATFDTDPDLLNCRSGVVNLRTGELIPHDPEQRMTMQCRAAYDPDARAPRWEDFLAEVQPDPEMRAYLRRVMGYTLTGVASEQVFWIHYGGGANGKGVFREVTTSVLGPYAQSVPIETLMLKRNESSVSNDVARMHGRRFLAASESKQGRSFDEELLKQMTGEDTIAARFLHKEHFEFSVIGKLHLLTNNLPHVSRDYAMWRRIHLIPWTIQIGEERRNKLLKQSLLGEEASGILTWLVRGAMEWYANGLGVPNSALAAKAAYQKEEDAVVQFVEDCLREVEPKSGASGRSTRDIWQAWDRWVKAQAINLKIDQRALTKILQKPLPGRSKGFEYQNANSWRGFPGLEVRPDWVAL